MARRLAVLPAVVEARARAAAEGDEGAVRRHSPPVRWRKLRMVIPTLAVFGTSRTLRGRESKGLTRRPVVVAVAAEVAVAALRAAAEPKAMWRQSPLGAVALPVVARRVARAARVVALLVEEELAAAGLVAAAEPDGLSIHQTAKSHTRPRQEPSSRTSSRITWPTNRS